MTTAQQHHLGAVAKLVAVVADATHQGIRTIARHQRVIARIGLHGVALAIARQRQIGAARTHQVLHIATGRETDAALDGVGVARGLRLHHIAAVVDNKGVAAGAADQGGDTAACHQRVVGVVGLNRDAILAATGEGQRSVACANQGLHVGGEGVVDAGLNSGAA